MTTASSSASELVPLAERLRYLQMLRATVSVCVLAYVLVAGQTLGYDVQGMAIATGAFAVVSALGELIWRQASGRSLPLFGGLLIVDGIYLAWISWATGAESSPLRYLVFLHLITVALLASYRTSLKLAVWHSLLAYSVFRFQESGIAADGSRAEQATDARQLAAFVAVLWLVAIATCSFSAVNERELRRRRFDLEELARMATQLESTTTPAGVAETLLSRVVDAFDLERGLVIGITDDVLEVLASQGTAPPHSHRSDLYPESALARSVANRRTLLRAELDTFTDGWLTAQLPKARNVVIVPMYAEGGAHGILVIEHALRTGSRIERRVVSILERFSSHAALALLNARLLQQLQKSADTDGLTGLANRRSFDEALARETGRCLRTGEPLCLVMLDLDHFKRLNDEHGHQAGDETLRQVAAILRDHCRPYDTVARYGGEELAMILPSCAAVDAIHLAERVREVISQISSPPGVTVSAGIAVLRDHALDEEGLIANADAALYASKRAGRNRVTMAGSYEPVTPAPAALT